MRALTQLLKALADPTRLRLALALRHGELCVCQLNTIFGVSPSTLSRHLAALERAGVVRSRKEGRWVYYAAAPRGTPAVTRRLLHWLRASAQDDPQARADARQLARVRCQPPERWCRPARRGSHSAPSHRHDHE